MEQTSQKLLNKEQLSAIKHDIGPLLIIAGAGTGKTTVITERIKYLIVDKNVLPQNILALTFTDKAAHEMQERVDRLLPYGYTNLWIHTFHSFCDRILRDEVHHIGLDPGYKLISESESILLLRKNIFELGLNIFKPMGNPTKFVEALLSHFSRLKDEDISPSDYLKWASKNKEDNHDEYLELAEAYEKYEKLKISESGMDFSDLISNTLKLFRTRPNVLKKYQKQFSYLLVDEFQDTNYAQNELAILLAGNEKNITVVADDDQSIYRFRGAAVSNVLQFKNNFPNTRVITLNQNYRSTQIILDRAYELIQHNNPNRLEVVEEIDKKLKSNSKMVKKDIQLIHENREEDEAEKIATTVRNLTSKSYNFRDIAILVRANNHAQAVTSAFERNKIPYQFLGPGYLFQQEEIKDLIAYLIFLTNLSDSVSLFRVLSMEIFKIPNIELNFLLNYAKKKNLSLFESIRTPDQPFISESTKEILIKFNKMTERHLELSKRNKAGQILYFFLIDTGLFNTFGKIDSVKDEKIVQNIAKFFDRIKSFEMENSESSIFSVVEWLNLMLQMGDSPMAADIDQRNEDAVNILTIHSSKGLEFKVVFLIDLVSDRFPSRDRKEKIPLPEGIIKETLPLATDFHLEEERRLFYVGMTRAREQLFFTAAEYYGNGKRPRKLSPFIFEALPSLQTATIENKSQQLSLIEVLSSYEQTEKVVEKKSPIKVDYITFSNLQMFDICPLHYKAKVIYNLPSPPTSAQSFGISIHNTLYDYYKRAQAGEVPTLKEFYKILDANWVSDGYQNKKHEEERFQQANKIINDYYEAEKDNPIRALQLEYPFQFNLKNGVKVFGKIDRIDQNGRGIEIIDYKTGQDNPKASTAHELQLAIYALAATRVKDNILNKNPEDITLTLQFLEGNTKKSMKFKKEDLDKLEDELMDKISEIESSDFKCSGNVLCVNCEFKMLCSTISS